jgi:hypothetical protein
MSDETPWVVEQGLEAEYDCPDCDFYKTSISTSMEEYLQHLQNEHGYTVSEACDILHHA